MKRSINDFFVSKVRCKVNSNVTNDSDIIVSNSKIITTVSDKDEQNIILSNLVPKNHSILDIKQYIDKKLTKIEKNGSIKYELDTR
jgi:galactitol-specific phosphotransferase system IIB component